MNSIERLTCESILTASLALQQAKLGIADRGAVRLGSGCITGGFPPLQQAKPEIADCGAVRLGSGCTAAALTVLR